MTLEHISPPARQLTSQTFSPLCSVHFPVLGNKQPPGNNNLIQLSKLWQKNRCQTSPVQGVSNCKSMTMNKLIWARLLFSSRLGVSLKTSKFTSMCFSHFSFYIFFIQIDDMAFSLFHSFEHCDQPMQCSCADPLH